MENLKILKSEHSEIIYKHFFPAWAGNGKNISCFSHEDNNPSLSIFQKAGEYRHHCHACGVSGDCLSIIGQLENIPDAGHQIGRLKEIAGITGKTQKPERIHIYNDENGQPLYRKLIFKSGDEKSASFERHESGQWVKGLSGRPQTLYNLPKLKDDTKSPVFLSESEKDADGLTGFNLLAISSGGAESWRPKYAELLKGREVVILPHNDTAGRKYAETAARSLSGIAASIKVVDPVIFGSSKGADVSDWLKAGGTKERLLEIISNAPEWEVSELSGIGVGQTDTPDFKPFSVLKKGSELGQLNITIEWAIDRLLPKQSITLLHGKGGIGKTWLSLIMADAINKGIQFNRLDTASMPVVFIDFENSLPVLIDRIKKIGIEDVLFWHNSNEKLKPPKLDKDDWTLYEQLPEGSLLIFDTLRASQGQDENDSRHMAFILSRLKELRDKGFTILLLHHTPKGNDRTYKGSTAILDLADHVLSLHKVRRNNPDGGEIEDDDDDNCLYRLGTKDKTRYEPFHIFMAFDKTQGFIPALDPDEDELRFIQETLHEKGTLNQRQIFEILKDELDIKSKGKVISLLRKGEPKFWISHKIKNAVYYETVRVSTPISGQTDTSLKDPIEVSRIERTDTLPNTLQPLDNSQVSKCPEGIQTLRTDDVIEVLGVSE